MDNSTILYIGMFCFAMIGLGMGLTVYEFKKIELQPVKKNLGYEERNAIEGLRTIRVAEIQ